MRGVGGGSWRGQDEGITWSEDSDRRTCPDRCARLQTPAREIRSREPERQGFQSRPGLAPATPSGACRGGLATGTRLERPFPSRTWMWALRPGLAASGAWGMAAAEDCPARIPQCHRRGSSAANQGLGGVWPARHMPHCGSCRSSNATSALPLAVPHGSLGSLPFRGALFLGRGRFLRMGHYHRRSPPPAPGCRPAGFRHHRPKPSPRGKLRVTAAPSISPQGLQQAPNETPRRAQRAPRSPGPVLGTPSKGTADISRETNKRATILISRSGRGLQSTASARSRTSRPSGTGIREREGRMCASGSPVRGRAVLFSRRTHTLRSSGHPPDTGRSVGRWGIPCPTCGCITDLMPADMRVVNMSGRVGTESGTHLWRATVVVGAWRRVGRRAVLAGAPRWRRPSRAVCAGEGTMAQDTHHDVVRQHPAPG